MKLRVLDLFSGIGGFSLGLERTGGFETVAFCEIEEYPRQVLSKQNSGLCALTASDEVYGSSQRDRFERKDDEGYRISKEAGFS